MYTQFRRPVTSYHEKNHGSGMLITDKLLQILSLSTGMHIIEAWTATTADPGVVAAGIFLNKSLEVSRVSPAPM